MSFVNHTPFSAVTFRQFNLTGQLIGVMSVRGTFLLGGNGDPLEQARQQCPLVMSDVYGGNPHRTTQTAQTDLVPYKPGTDVTFLGTSYSPDGQPAQTWLCGLKMRGVRKVLRVHGPRFWEPVLQEDCLSDWRLTASTPVTEVPLDWSYAWGGPLPVGEGKPNDACPFNPLGCGIVSLKGEGPFEPVRAPQIEDPDDPVVAWNRDYDPKGMGPVSPWWRQRQQHAGTYDDEWKNSRHPLLPKDFNYRFYQAAVPDMVVSPWLGGDEEIILVNLVKGHERFVTRLPEVRLRMRLTGGPVDFYGDPVLDGVHFDLRSGIEKVFLTWRMGFPWSDRQGTVELGYVNRKQGDEASRDHSA